MPRYRFQQGEGCTVGAIDFEVPGAPGRISVAAVGDDKADALGRAALVAERIASDPIMAALLPPQAAVAIKVAKGLSAAAKRGAPYIRHFWRKLRGPGKKRLAKVLHKEAVQREADADANVSGWPYQRHVRDIERPDVGDVSGVFSALKKAASYHPAAIVARKLRKKKKRKVPPMRRPVARERDEEPADEEPMDNQSAPAQAPQYANDGGSYADEGYSDEGGEE